VHIISTNTHKNKAYYRPNNKYHNYKLINIEIYLQTTEPIRLQARREGKKEEVSPSPQHWGGHRWITVLHIVDL